MQKAILARPSTWTRRRKLIAVAFLAIVFADIDANGTCACDDFAPRVSALTPVSSGR